MCLCFQIAVFTQGAQFLDEFWTEERISFVLTVSRENLLNGTLSSLVSADDMELKKPLRVSLCPCTMLWYMASTIRYIIITLYVHVCHVLYHGIRVGMQSASKK